MGTQSNVELVQEAYAAFGAGNVEKLLGLMASDIVWEFPASKDIPWAGTFTGPGEVAREPHRLSRRPVGLSQTGLV